MVSVAVDIPTYLNNSIDSDVPDLAESDDDSMSDIPDLIETDHIINRNIIMRITGNDHLRVRSLSGGDMFAPRFAQRGTIGLMISDDFIAGG